MKTYRPELIDLDEMELSVKYEPIVDRIAERIHDVWAAKHFDMGWRYGLIKDDNLMIDPDLVPFDEVSVERKYSYRDAARRHLKFLLSLGIAVQPVLRVS